jgi:hypothetical protein
MKNKVVFLILLLMSTLLMFSDVAEAKVVSTTTSLSSSRNQTTSITLPNFVSLNSVSVNTGNVSYTLNGNILNLTLSNGSIMDQDWDSTYYSNWVSGQYNQSYNSGGYSGWLSSYVYSGSDSDSYTQTDTSYSYGTSFSNAVNYNSGGYSGTLYKSGGYTTFSGTYVPSANRSETMYDYSGYSWRELQCKSGKYYFTGVDYQTDIGSTRYYNSGGYSGTLYRTGHERYADYGPQVDPGDSCTGTGKVQSGQRNKTTFTGTVTKPSTDDRIYAQNYRGTVYKPDTREYRYQGYVYQGAYVNKRYNYTVTVDYVDNRAPVVTGTIESGRFSQNVGHNLINVTGNVSDADGDLTTVHYQIGSKVGVLGTNISGNFTGNIPVDANVSEGSHVVTVWADDGNTSSTNLTQSVVIDKTHPTISSILTPSSWTTEDVLIKVTGIDPSGVKSVTPNSTLVTSNGTYNFTTTDNLNNSGVRSVSVTNIDRVSPTINIVSNGNNIFQKSHSTVINVNDTKDGSSVGSGIDTLEYIWSTSQVTPSTGFTSFINGSTLSSPVGVTGNYYLHIRSSDNLGQISNLVSNVFKVDNTPPVVGNLTLLLDGVGSIKANINGISDAHSGVDVTNAHSFRLDNLSYTGWMGNSNVFTGLIGNKSYGVTYKIRDKAGNESLVTVPKNLLSMTYNPLGLIVTGLSDGSIKVNISEANNESGSSYEVFAQNSSGVIAGNSSIYSTNLLNREITGLNTNEKYSIWVKSKNEDGVETTPSVMLLSTVFSGADVPELNLSDVTTSSMILDIDKNKNSTGTQYYVERALNNTFSTGKTVLSNWTTSLTVNSTGLVAGQTYYYRIKARNGDNVETSWSQVYTFKSIPSKVVLNVPTVVAYDGGVNTASIQLTWTDVLGEDKYYIYRDGTKVGEVTSNITTFVDNVSDFNQNYDYSVSGMNSQGEGSKSDIKNTYSRARDVDSIVISDLTDTVATFGVLNSSKNTNTPSTLIEVRRKSNGSVAGSSAFNKTETNRTVSGLQLGQSYEVWVTVRNEANVNNPAVKVIDEFYMNRPPEINLALGTDKYSEISGYNKIQVRGQVRDLDTIPVGDPLDIYYTIKNSSGNVLSGHSNVKLGRIIANGNLQNLNYDIPLTSNLVEGNYTIDVKVVDDQLEQDIETKSFLVDRSNPLAKLKEINGPNSYEATVEIYDVNGNIAGLHVNPYSVERALNKGSFSEITAYGTSDNIKYSNLESNTKYSYRAKVRDRVGHVTTSNLVELVTSPELIDREEDYLVTDPSTIVLEWVKPLKIADEVSIDIKRNGYLVAVIENGDRYLDQNLDYERNYIYDIIAYSTDENGKRIESVNIRKEVQTGQPLIQFELTNSYDSIKEVYNVNRTIFSDKSYVTSKVFYRPGGDIIVSYDDKKEGIEEHNFNIAPYDTKEYPLVLEANDGDEIEMFAEVDSSTVSVKAGLKASIRIKLLEIDNLNSTDYLNKFK